MGLAIASETWRRPKGRDLAILALAVAAHALVILALVSGAHWMPQMVAPPIIEAELLDEIAPHPEAVTPATPSALPPKVARPQAPASAPAPPPVIATRPSGPPAIVAPPGFTARKLSEESDQTRESLRGSLGCRHEKVVALNRDQKTVCAEADGQRSRTAPMYAAIDPDKKAAFDGDCAKDDDWCLYRVGKGPYPGIFALGKKKKRKGWDD